jgi:hypothetical protein
MAVLGSNFLNGCNSIPSFIAAGSRMVFEQDNAPTSWTKETNAAFNNVALRLIGGANGTALVPRAATAFTSIFPASVRGLANFTVSGPANVAFMNPAAPDTTKTFTTGASSASIFTSQTALTQAQTKSHEHDYNINSNGTGNLVATGPQQHAPTTDFEIRETGFQGDNQQHSHGVISDHSHTLTLFHQHPVSDPGHTHTVSMTQRDFSILYMDVIICSKN